MVARSSSIGGYRSNVVRPDHRCAEAFSAVGSWVDEGTTHNVDHNGRSIVGGRDISSNTDVKIMSSSRPEGRSS